jgi:phosphoribosylglycinamide formyltransferase 1
MRRVAVLASGHGSNLQALIDAGLPIACVISDRSDAFALERARSAGIAAEFVDPSLHRERDAYATALDRVLSRHGVDLVVLAGFMRILGSALVQGWYGRMVNIHPSLLPKYRGLDTHRRVLAAGDDEHGASVHFVTEELDGGPVILRVRVPVHPGDDLERLRQRVQAEEHRVYPFIVGLLARGRITLGDQAVELDGAPLAEPFMVEPGTDLTCIAA